MRAGQLGLGVLVLMGCAGPSADHERLGDRAYREGELVRALAEYQAASASAPRSRVWAKLGTAALHLREYGTATEAFVELSRSDPTRADEAARGLVMVARLSAQEGGGAGPVGRAITALRTVAPNRPLGRLAVAPARSGGLDRGEALAVLPVALAAADRGAPVDSLLLRYGQVLRESLACDQATGVFRTLLRRSRTSAIAARARGGLADCALLLGLDALVSERLVEAERWFDEAASTDYGGPVGWRARIGYGDARQRQGDLLGAAVAYQSVLSSPAVPDSLLRLAGERLNAIGGGSPPPDSLPFPVR